MRARAWRWFIQGICNESCEGLTRRRINAMPFLPRKRTAIVLPHGRGVCRVHVDNVEIWPDRCEVMLYTRGKFPPETAEDKRNRRELDAAIAKQEGRRR